MPRSAQTRSSALKVQARKSPSISAKAFHETAQQRNLRQFIVPSQKTQTIRFLDKKKTPHDFEIPTEMLQLLADMLDRYPTERMRTLAKLKDKPLTTQQAADILNVSRPYLIKLLDNGAMPHHKVGNQRRIDYDDVMNYKAQQKKESQEALRELTALSQELKLPGYE